MLRGLAVVAGGVFILTASATADDGDAFRGKAFAQQLCAGCHAIEGEGAQSPLGAAPPFSKVAVIEGKTSEWFADWLGTAHPVINGVAVKPAIAADILAYIHTLAPAKQHASLD